MELKLDNKLSQNNTIRSKPDLQVGVTTPCYKIGHFFFHDVPVACAITYPFISEKGEVTSPHYKLFSADIRDIPKLDSVIHMAKMDPR